MKHKKRKILLGVIAGMLVLALSFSILYVQDYYHAGSDVQLILEQENAGYEIVEEENAQIAFIPENPVAGLIFYPGGKVEYEAYVPLMAQLASRNILCVLVHMPANLAVLDMNAADGICETYTQVSCWYIGGHSLGAAMAASYISNHTEEYEGLILLGGYSTKDLSRSQLSILSIYGSEDGVLSRESYQKYASNLPQNAVEVIIEGGCHSYFGDYGLQEGDGTPSISRQEQMEQTANEIEKLILSSKSTQ